MKQGTTWAIVAIAVIAAISLTIGLMGGFQGQLGAVTQPGDDAADGEAPWADKLVPVELLVSDKYDSSQTVNATAKVYADEPEDWENPRGDFDDSTLYTEYTGTSGAWDTIEVNKENPGTYYVVLTASGYNTEFGVIEIPDGSETSDSLSDYKGGVDTLDMSMTQVGSTTDEDFDFTLTNETNTELSDTILLTVAEDTEFRGWKVVVDDTEGFSTDADNDGTYDEGIHSYAVTFQGEEYEIFDPDNGVDEFDSNDEFEFSIEGVSVADKDKVEISVDIEADTGDYTGANDEVWGEGEGVLSQIVVRDAEANLFATVDVTA